MLACGADIDLTIGRKKFRATNLDDPVKRRLLEYYIEIAPAILPHLKQRPIVTVLPAARPSWIRTCGEWPLVQDLGGLLWLVNAGGPSLTAWPARCDAAHRPDYMQLAIEAVEFGAVLEGALRLRDHLSSIGMTGYAKTSGGRGIHVCVPIKRGPLQRDVWGVAGEIAIRIRGNPRIAWDRSLRSVYSAAGYVSAPVSWEEVEQGFRPEDFRIDTTPARLREIGDLWKPLTLARGRIDLERLVRRAAA